MIYNLSTKTSISQSFIKCTHFYERTDFLSLYDLYYDLYIEDMSHRLRQNSIDGKKNVFKNRILPYFKDKPINAITPADIRSWQNEQIDMGYSDAYLDRIQNIMTAILNYAVTYYNLPANPCTKAGHMGKRTRSMNFWTIEQYNQFIQILPTSDSRTHWRYCTDGK